MISKLFQILFKSEIFIFCSFFEFDYLPFLKTLKNSDIENERVKVLVAQSGPTVCNPMDYSPPGSLSMESSRQKYWSGLPFPSPGDIPHPGIEPRFPELTFAMQETWVQSLG